MAGDWIKMETELHEKPEVIELAGILKIDRFAVVGRLHRVWSWFNKHTENGHAPSVTNVTVDEFVFCDGFADAMVTVGWAVNDGDGFKIPHFERHNGNPAKTRALSASRKRRSRLKRDECHGGSVTKSGQERDQRREEKRSTKHTPNAREGQVKRLLAVFNIDTPIERIGPEATRIFADPATAGFLDDEAFDTIRRKAPEWLAQDWIKDISPRFIAERLAEIYNFQPKAGTNGADRYANGF